MLSSPSTPLHLGVDQVVHFAASSLRRTREELVKSAPLIQVHRH